jgi:hypothetical protein
MALRPTRPTSPWHRSIDADDHFALDTAADEIAALVRGFVAVHPEPLKD